jgi:myo-inositol-1(or 4)-monophosphatase
MTSRERTVALDLARAAGAMLREELGHARQVDLKSSPINLVTEMDRRSETLIVSGLRAAFPDDAILAEEQGVLAGRSGRRWIVDPLDGTTNYAHGLPIFAVSIALERAGRVVLGVIHDPNHGETFVVERGRGAELDGRPLAVSRTKTLDESLLVTGFPYDIRVQPENNLREYAAFSLQSRGVRRLGSAVLDFAYVAAGRIDGYWELRLGTWDAAAGSLLVEEAGGRVTDLDGSPMNLAAPRIVASNGLIHDELLETLRELRQP